MGTAGFGAELEHSLPILVGGLSPEGFVKVVGLETSDRGTVDAVVLTEAASDDVDDGAGGCGVASTGASTFSLILMHFFFYFLFIQNKSRSHT